MDNHPSRKDIRLKNWDYSQNACYHVTICASGMACMFGRVVDPSGAPLDSPPDKETLEAGVIVALSPFGQMCREALEATVAAFPSVEVVIYAIMPNHVHMLVRINGKAGSPKLGEFVRSFKARAARAIRKTAPGTDVWQRNYYEHVIRNDGDFERTWEYIAANPGKWFEDKYYMR